MKINTNALLKADANWFLEQMKKVQAFSVLSDKELMHLVSQMRSYDFAAGTTLVNQGESANLFFIVHEGIVDVSVKKYFFRNKKVATLKEGDFFGESVLVGNSKRTATVTAKTNASCYVLLRPSFRFMLQENLLFKESLKAVFSKRKLQLKKA